jgi:hypothetical protein
MQDFLLQVPDWIELIAIFLLALVILATIVARITPTKRDDEAVSKLSAFLLKYLAYLPTFGVNPRTRQLEETLKMVEASKATPDAETKSN